MKTRNAETPRSGPSKKTPVKKTPPKPSEDTTVAAAVAAAAAAPALKTASTTAPKQVKSGGTSKPAVPKTASKPQPKDASGSTAKVTPEVKVVSTAKPASKMPAKVTKSSPKTVAATKTEKKAASEKPLKKREEVAVEDISKKEEPAVAKVDYSSKKEEEVVESPKKEEPIVDNVVELKDEEEEDVEEEPEEEEEEEKEVDEKSNAVNMEEDAKEEGEGKEDEPEESDHNADERMEEDDGENEGFEEPDGEESEEDDELEVEEEGGRLEEHMEMSALAKERKIKKEQEIFVGGLDRDCVEEDIKKVFEKIGEVVDVRLHKNPVTNKNKGYAFVKFANKELATRALNELKNPMIRGKRCGTAPSEDNDTLFVGNICNTWTKEAIKKKLKEYGLEAVENVTLVSDAQHEGLSRGFAFVEFSCHADAMLAYKRLQKPDVIFGHAERTVKVAFAEPLREPDPEVMAQVKSVFVDGLPPHWDEERVRENFQSYGEIERIVLARNMPTAKRKDFGFIDFNTHEAAMACIDRLNNTELGDEKSKTKVKVRLSNPMPKTQAVKGGLCGGFRIGHAGRGFGRGGRPVNRANVQRGRGFYARGRGRTGRFTFSGESLREGPYSGFRGRRPFGGRGQRGYGATVSSRTATSSRPDFGRSRYGATERGRGKSIQTRRQPLSSEGNLSRSLGSRHYVDDPYAYDDSGYGIKRPYSMVDHEPDYLEPSRVRPRFDYSDPASSHDAHYQDSYGTTGSGLYSRDYYGSTYGGGAYSSTYGGDRSYGSGYYY